jgi:hypothetical protein
MARLWLACALILLLGPRAAWAQTASRATRTTTFLRFAGKTEILIRSRWSKPARGNAATASVELELGGSKKPVELYKGKTVRADVATRPGSVLVALIHGGAAPTIRFALADVSGKNPKLASVKVARPTDTERRPASVVACGDPQGFTVLWQEESIRDPNADVKTYFCRVAPDGTLIEKPRLVAVPWALAGLVHNGHGYHLGLFYDGAQPGQTRLAMVTLNDKGAPEQHPWWATAPGDLADVQLVAVGGRVTAFFRGGPSAEDLESTDVTAVGQWGREPAAAARHGKISGETFGVRVEGGKPSIRRRAAAPFH